MSTHPSIEATIHADGTASITMGGQTTHLDTGSVEEARSRTLALVAEQARGTGAPASAVMHDAQGSWPVTMHPDGRVEPGPKHTGEPLDFKVLPLPLPAAIAPKQDEHSSLPEYPAHPEHNHLEHSDHDHPEHEEQPGQPVSGGGSTPPPLLAGSDIDAHEHPVADIEEMAEPDAPKGPAIGTDNIDGQDTAAAADDAKRHMTGTAPTPAETGSLVPPQNPLAGASALPEHPEHPETRASFLTHEQTDQPAGHGWRGALARLGLRMEPSESERAERADEQAVSQHWPGQRTIAVVNGKGGVGKTPTTVVLSAVFARYGGAGVLAWDNNQTRGTLGWRTEQGPHESTVLDMLPETDRLLSAGAQSADLARFVHHQGRDKFDVLRSKPMALAHEQRVSPHDVDAIHAVAAKYYRLILMDSGNDESDPMWLRMIDHADQLVLATTTRKDHAEAGALLLEALAERNEHSASLAREAVAVITRADPKATGAEMENIAAGYGSLVRQVVRIPHDPALVDGQITYEALHRASQRAWLTAAAAVANGLGKPPKDEPHANSC